jgi:cytochrome P450
LDYLGLLVWEALRFEPPFPLLVRYCPRATALGGVPVNAGSTVLVSTLSAMFDPEFAEEPSEFSVLRRSEEYLIFGHGQHECVARHLAEIGIPQLIAVVLSSFRIKSAGTLGHDGSAVARYPVSLDLPTAALVSHHATVSIDYPGHRQTGTYLKHPSSGRIRVEPSVEKTRGSGAAR